MLSAVWRWGTLFPVGSDRCAAWEATSTRSRKRFAKAIGAAGLVQFVVDRDSTLILPGSPVVSGHLDRVSIDFSRRRRGA